MTGYAISNICEMTAKAAVILSDCYVGASVTSNSTWKNGSDT